MATSNSIAGQSPSSLRRKTLRLDPKLFSELDAIARTVAGSALEVIPAEEMPNTIARIQCLMGSGYVDARVTSGSCMMDLSIIEIANSVDPDEVHGWDRPELDYSQIPTADLYHFALWHEIGHRRDNLNFWGKLPDSLPYQGLLTWLNEVRADRFAWSRLYPDQPLPRRPHAVSRARRTAQEMAKMERLFPPHRASRKPLPTAPHLAIPASHVRRGIPWASDQRGKGAR